MVQQLDVVDSAWQPLPQYLVQRPQWLNTACGECQTKRKCAEPSRPLNQAAGECDLLWDNNIHNRSKGPRDHINRKILHLGSED